LRLANNLSVSLVLENEIVAVYAMIEAARHYLPSLEPLHEAKHDRNTPMPCLRCAIRVAGS